MSRARKTARTRAMQSARRERRRLEARGVFGHVYTRGRPLRLTVGGLIRRFEAAGYTVEAPPEIPADAVVVVTSFGAAAERMEAGATFAHWSSEIVLTELDAGGGS